MKGKFRKLLLLCIVASLAVLAVFAYLSYKLKQAVPVSFESIEVTESGGVKINKVSYSGTRDGRTAWELEAESATHFKDDDLTLLDKVKLTLYSEDGDVFYLTSNSARYNGETELITATGDVVVESKESFRLFTDTLSFINGSGEIKTDDDVRITTDAMVIEGRGLTVDIESGKLKILSNVKARVKDGSF